MTEVSEFRDHYVATANFVEHLGELLDTVPNVNKIVTTLVEANEAAKDWVVWNSEVCQTLAASPDEYLQDYEKATHAARVLVSGDLQLTILAGRRAKHLDPINQACPTSHSFARHVLCCNLIGVCTAADRSSRNGTSFVYELETTVSTEFVELTDLDVETADALLVAPASSTPANAFVAQQPEWFKGQPWLLEYEGTPTWSGSATQIVARMRHELAPKEDRPTTSNPLKSLTLFLRRNSDEFAGVQRSPRTFEVYRIHNQPTTNP